MKKTYYVVYHPKEDHYRLAYGFDQNDPQVLSIDAKVGAILEKTTAVEIRDALNTAGEVGT